MALFENLKETYPEAMDEIKAAEARLEQREARGAELEAAELELKAAARYWGASLPFSGDPAMDLGPAQDRLNEAGLRFTIATDRLEMAEDRYADALEMLEHQLAE
jgi:hypothetical protein